MHELTHVHQWVSGSLTSVDRKMRYKGEVINRDDYDNQPHEIDARKRELILYSHFTGNPKYYRHIKKCPNMVVHVGQCMYNRCIPKGFTMNDDLLLIQDQEDDLNEDVFESFNEDQLDDHDTFSA